MSFGKCGSYIYPFNCCNPKSASIQPTSQKTKHTEPTSLETKATEPTVKDKEDEALKIQSFYRGHLVRSQITEIKKVITQLKEGGTPEKDVNKIRERLYKSLENGNLDLSYCQISDEILSQIRPLLSVLNIKELDLYNNQIASAGAIALAEALETNTSIKKLDLWDNNIGNEGTIALAEIIKTNTSIKKLDLRHNQIGTEGAIALAIALKINTSLTHLYLGGNHLRDAGAIALAEALKINDSLTHLDIGCNNIGSDGAKALAKAVIKNTSLTKLDLFWNSNIGPEGTTAIAKALEENKSLTKLNLWGNNLGPDLDEKIKKELDINKKIASIEKEALIKTMILTKRLINKKVSGPKGFLGPLVMSFIIGDFISEDAFQKLQTISERKYLAAATTIQKIVRGHQVRIK